MTDHNKSFLFIQLIISAATANAAEGDSYFQFYNISLKWIETARFCNDRGGNLAHENSQHSPFETTFWSGSYFFYTWKIIWGCFQIKEEDKNKTIIDENMTDKMCQSHCLNFTYFSVKVQQCLCLNDELQQPTNYKPCNGEQKFIVYRNGIPSTLTYNQQGGNCLSVECSSDVVTFARDPCNAKFKVICDDGKDVSFNSVKTGASLCLARESFIKWMEPVVCGYSTNYSGQYWTSGRRVWFENNVTDKEINLIKPIRCLRIFWNSSSILSKRVNCETKLPFYCSYAAALPPTANLETTTGSHASDSVTKSFTENKLSLSDSQINVGIPVGIAVAVILIVCISITVLLVARKRASHKNQKHPVETSPYVYNNVDANQSQHRSFSVANQSYDDMNDGFCNSTNKTMHIPINEFAKDAAKVKLDTMPASSYELAKDIHHSNKAENYDFAQPIANESDYVYNSDYDHLHKILKTQKDSDYALTCPEIKYERNSKTYDTFASTNASDGQQPNSDYHHLPTNIGNDPTYDCAAIKRRNQEENSYDSFSH